MKTQGKHKHMGFNGSQEFDSFRAGLQLLKPQ